MPSHERTHRSSYRTVAAGTRALYACRVCDDEHHSDLPALSLGYGTAAVDPDGVRPHQRLDGGLNIPTLLALLLAGTLAVEISAFSGFWLEGRIIVNVETLLRRNLLAHIYTRPGARALPTSSGEALSRFRDDTRAVLRFLTYAPDIPSQIVVLAISLAILASINVWFTLAVFIPLLVTIVAVNVATQRIRRYHQINQEATAAVTGTLGEIFGAVQSIKAAGTEQHVMRFFSAVNERRRLASLRDLLLMQILSLFAANAANISIGVLLMLAAQAVQQGARPLTVGDLALFVSYLTALAGLIGFFGEIMTRYRQTEVSFQRLLALMPDASPEELVKHMPLYLRGDLPAVPRRSRQPDDALDTLVVDNLEYHYPGSERGNSGVSLTIRRGDFVVDDLSSALDVNTERTLWECIADAQAMGGCRRR